MVGIFFCKYSALHAHSITSTFRVLVKLLFAKFTRAKGKDGILTNHATNVYHQEPFDRAKAFTYQDPQARIDNCISVEAQRLSEANRHILVRLLKRFSFSQGRICHCEVTGMTVEPLWLTGETF